MRVGERKLCYILANLMDRDHMLLSFRSRYAPPEVQNPGSSATDVAMSPQHTTAMDLSTLTITDGKQHGSQIEPDRDAQEIHGKWVILTKEYLVLPCRPRLPLHHLLVLIMTTTKLDNFLHIEL